MHSGQIPDHDAPAPASHTAGTAVRAGADRYVADLQAQLTISAPQMGAWKQFAASLRANRRRMQAFEDEVERPFGTLEDRLVARDTMQRAATGLFAVLDMAQQRTAARLLPLCCLPHAAGPEANKGHRAEQGAASMADLVQELERNARYYSAGPDRDAGDLLRRAARALAQHR
jgi:hypothetical protein